MTLKDFKLKYSKMRDVFDLIKKECTINDVIEIKDNDFDYTNNYIVKLGNDYIFEFIQFAKEESKSCIAHEEYKTKLNKQQLKECESVFIVLSRDFVYIKQISHLQCCNDFINNTVLWLKYRKTEKLGD